MCVRCFHPSSHASRLTHSVSHHLSRSVVGAWLTSLTLMDATGCRGAKSAADKSCDPWQIPSSFSPQTAFRCCSQKLPPLPGPPGCLLYPPCTPVCAELLLSCPPSFPHPQRWPSSMFRGPISTETQGSGTFLSFLHVPRCCEMLRQSHNL